MHSSQVKAAAHGHDEYEPSSEGQVGAVNQTELERHLDGVSLARVAFATKRTLPLVDRR